MEPFSLRSELPLPKTAHSKRSDLSPDPKVRVKSAIKMFPGPFQGQKNTIRKNSLQLKSNASFTKLEEKPQETPVLPNLYTVMRQMSKEKLRTGALTPSLPSVEPDFEEANGEVPSISCQQTITIEKKRNSLKTEIFLRDNSFDIDQKQAKKSQKHKHSLATFSRVTALRPRRISGNLPTNIRMKKRSTIATTEQESIPAITLSLIESQAEESRVEEQRQTASSGNLLGPPTLASRKNTFRAVTSSLRSMSPISSAGSDVESSASVTPKVNVSCDTSDAESSFDSGTDLCQPSGLWSPWANHLTPFHDLIEMSGRPTRVYQYLKRKKNSMRSERESATLFDMSFNHKTGLREGIACTCAHPMLLRNMRKFLVQGISRINQSLNVRKLNHLQVLISPSHDDPNSKFLFIHIDGVIADVHKPIPFDKSPYNYYLRPGVIEGLRLLARSFAIVFLSNLPTPRFYKVLDYLIQRKVTITGAYCIQSSSCEERFLDPNSSYFQDYTQLYYDLHIKHPDVPHRVLVLGAILTEISPQYKEESVLYSSTGLEIRLSAKHWPVVMPAQGANVITMLIPHLRVESYDSALRFTVVHKEITRIAKAAKSGNWDDAFQSLQNSDISAHVGYIRTFRVAEAYYSYLLPLLRSEDCAEVSSKEKVKQPPLCNAHPVAQSIASLLTENRVILVTGQDDSAFGKSEMIDSDPFVLRSKSTTLLDFATLKEPCD